MLEPKRPNIAEANRVKCDHAPWASKGEQLLHHVMNFRRHGARGRPTRWPIYGVAQTTVDGWAEVMTKIKDEEKDLKQMIWITLRDEPVIYVIGRSYATRDRRKPTEYALQAGCEHNELQELEERLKADIENEAARTGGRVLLQSEREERDSHYAYWKPLDVAELCCQHEILHRLKDLHFPDLMFARFSITDNLAPEEKEFNRFVFELVPKLRKAHHNRDCRAQGGDECAAVFNCLMGQGRTTTGMVVTALLCQVLSLGDAAPDKECIDGDTGGVGLPGLIDDIVKKLKYGVIAKRRVDSEIDDRAHMVNLRTIIRTRRECARHAKTWDQWDSNRRKYVNFTERYLYLIIFSHYLWTEIKDGAGAFPRKGRTFQQHMLQLQEEISIYEMLDAVDQLGMDDQRHNRQSSQSQSDRWHQPERDRGGAGKGRYKAPSRGSSIGASSCGSPDSHQSAGRGKGIGRAGGGRGSTSGGWYERSDERKKGGVGASRNSRW